MTTTPNELLAAITAWHTAYAQIEARAEKIAHRLIRLPVNYTRPAPVYAAHYGLIATYDGPRMSVTTRRRDKRFQIISILTRRPAFMAVQARYDAALRIAA